MCCHKKSLGIWIYFRKEWAQIISILIACFSGLIYGLSFAWTSPSIPKIVHDKDHYNIGENEASYFTIVPYISMALTIVPISYLNDIIGRKYTILLMAIPCILHWILVIFAQSVYTFYVARLSIGVTECLFISLPMYVGEISSPKIRGTWGNAFSISINFGILLINIIGSYCDIQTTAYICLLLCIIFVLIMPFVPETPHFLIMKNQNERAQNTLKWLYQGEEMEEIYKSIKEDVEVQLSEQKSWYDLLKANKRALVAALFIQTSVPFSGITAFVSYSQQIFNRVNGSISSKTSSIIIPGIIVLLSVFASWTVDKLGRKKSFTYSCIFCTLLLLVEALYFWADDMQLTYISQFNWIPLSAMILFFIAHTIGIGTVSLLMLEELFSVNMKTKGLCFCTIFFGLTGAINNELFQILQSNFGLHASFLYFSCTCSILFVFSLYLIPETAGKTLEEIQISLKNVKT